MINYTPPAVTSHQLWESGLHQEGEQDERYDLDSRAGYQERPVRG